MFDLPNRLSDLIQFDAATLIVSSREGKRCEFKRSFNAPDFSEYTKTLAAFANADGGILVFGVSERPRQMVGVDRAALPDEANWSNRLREDFDPEIVISTRLYREDRRDAFVVGVDPSLHRPVICRKTRTKQIRDKDGRIRDTEVLREGAIYFRYAGQTRAIGFTELAAMLADREKRNMQKIMETLKVVERVGLGNTGVIDLAAGIASNIFVSRETAKELAFIDRASLVEEKGAPAYVVVGQAQIGNVVHAPLDDADKNLPSEAAIRLRPLVAEVYGKIQLIHASQVTQLLKHLKLHDNERFCVQEKKLRRKYITRAGVNAISEFIRTKPLDAIKSFGSRAAIARYEAEQRR